MAASSLLSCVFHSRSLIPQHLPHNTRQALRSCTNRGNFEQFEEMYEQRRTEVNKAAEKYEKQIKAAKRSGNKSNQVRAWTP